MPNPVIEHPSRAVPFVALAYGDSGAEAVAVSATNPIPSRDRPYRDARGLVANTVVTPGQAVLVDCAGEGKIAFELASGTQVLITVPAGLVILPLAAQRFLSAGTTAQFSAWVLD